MHSLSAFCFYTYQKEFALKLAALPRDNFQILLQIPICMNADNGVSPAATSTPLGKNPTQILNTSSTPEAMQDVECCTNFAERRGNSTRLGHGLS